MREKTGFIGTGRMGMALMQGFLKARLLSKTGIIAYDEHTEKQAALKKQGITLAKNNKDLVRRSKTIIIAVKPKDVPALLDEIKDDSGGKLFISIAAGITTGMLEQKLKGRVIRVMPNTPCIAYHGACAFTLGRKATAGDAAKVKRLLSALGITEQLPEELMDAATGLSGSGPAYIYLVVKALAEAGIEEGLPPETALRLAAQTAKGAAEMILTMGKTPQQLIDDVCSPGGTTIEGMKKLEEKKAAEAFKHAVAAATKRSKELSG
ncbi:MAG: pyrroline-5-carboxylate reductase [Candidatus Altiarchaeota archaeon]|nr:pyrroline-5-carboxylate reductase [Candidatus Altiarchaeota archaeon]